MLGCQLPDMGKQCSIIRFDNCLLLTPAHDIADGIDA